MIQILFAVLFVYFTVLGFSLICVFGRALNPYRPWTPKQARKYLLLCFVWPFVLLYDFHTIIRDTVKWLFSDLTSPKEKSTNPLTPENDIDET